MMGRIKGAAQQADALPLVRLWLGLCFVYDCLDPTVGSGPGHARHI